MGKERKGFDIRLTLVVKINKANEPGKPVIRMLETNSQWSSK